MFRKEEVLNGGFMFKKQRLIYLLFIVGLFSGCATIKPEMVQKENAEWQAEADRFEQAKTLSVGEIPNIYNVSRLCKGSNVKIKHTRNNSDEPSFITETVRDVKVDNKGKIYVIDSTVSERTFTFQEDSVSLQKIVSPYENKQPLADIEVPPDGNNLPTALLQGAIAGGALGVAVNALNYSHTKEIYRDTVGHMKSMRIETKVIDFKFVSDERLKIAGKDILCKVYQIHSLTKQTMALSKRIPSSSLMSDKSEKMWVSDDVPFGVVKRESTQTFICMNDNSRYPMTIAPTSQITHESSEVVEFKY